MEPLTKVEMSGLKTKYVRNRICIYYIKTFADINKHCSKTEPFDSIARCTAGGTLKAPAERDATIGD